MSELISQIKGIGEFISTITGFVSQFFESLNAIIHNIPGTLSFLTGAIVSLPTFVTAFASITLAITIAYFLIGRTAGGVV